MSVVGSKITLVLLKMTRDLKLEKRFKTHLLVSLNTHKLSHISLSINLPFVW